LAIASFVVVLEATTFGATFFATMALASSIILPSLDKIFVIWIF
jgi:hypothetical protein